MIKSMTGFGRGAAENDFNRITAEVKAVNHRFCEVNIRMPRQLGFFEDTMKKWISSRLNRGKVDLFITLEQLQAKNAVLKVDKELAKAYYDSVSELSGIFGVPGDLQASQLLNLPGVFTLETAEEDQDELARLLQSAVEEAVSGLLAMRDTEGQALATDMLGHLNLIESDVDQIAGFAATVVDEQKQRLEQRLALILGEVEIDQNRLANELAFFADKVDINEELKRLGSHISQFRASVEYNEPIGRKLDFILQEMLRETNTIGSKSNNLSINRLVIDVKNELERMKEQVQNVE